MTDRTGVGDVVAAQLARTRGERRGAQKAEQGLQRRAELVALAHREIESLPHDRHEIERGESYPLPGHVVEGGSTSDRKVLVGWFGPVEIPFVLRRVGSDWKVEAEPYFAFMNR